MNKELTRRPIYVYDLETQTAIDYSSGKANLEELKISIAGVWDYESYKLYGLREGELPHLLPKLKQAQLLIGFNSLGFDNAVLQNYYKDFEINSIPQLDLLDSVKKVLGFRLKLQTLVEATLKEGKSGSGLEAVEYFREGEWQKLEKYCLDDVRLTKDLFEYGVYHGYVWYSAGDKLIKIPVNWHEFVPEYDRSMTVEDKVNKALLEGLKLQVTYILPEEKEGNTFVHRPEWSLDVLNIKEDNVSVFIQELQKDQTIKTSQILKADFSGNSEAFQPSLF